MSWEFLEDPTGRLRTGYARFVSSVTPRASVRILGFCAPAGLYRRPLVESDRDTALGRLVQEMGSNVVPCESTHPQAQLEYGNLMAVVQYLQYSSGSTTVYANHLMMVDDFLEVA